MNTLNAVHGNSQSILDLSPSKIKDEFNTAKLAEVVNNDQIKSEEVNGKAINDCPTAILVDFLSGSSSCLKKNCIASNTHYNCTENDKLCEDLKEKELAYTNIKNCGEKKYIDNSPDSNENRMSIRRLHWKPFSPRSMSHISREASKIVHCLNSERFDEDSLLTEESLPIPINLEDLDFDDNTNQKDSSDSSEHEISSPKLSANVQTEIIINSTDKNSKETNDPNISEDSNSFKINLSDDSSVSLSSEKMLSGMKIQSIDQLASNKSCLSDVHSDSQDSSSISVSYEEDVFINYVSSEDKENIKEIENQAILIKEKKSVKSPNQNLFVSKTKLGYRGTLRNLSNIEHESEISGKLLSPVHRNVNSPLKKMNRSASTKKTQTRIGKLQIKKTALSLDIQNSSKAFPRCDSFETTRELIPAMEKTHLAKNATSLLNSACKHLSPVLKCQNASNLKISPKIIPRSNSFQSAKKVTSGMEKPCLTKRNASFMPNSACKSLSSELKHQNIEMKTPSKRYSLCMPLKSTPARKLSFAPALSNCQNPALPHSLHASRLSYSRSLQQSTDKSLFSTSKVLKQQNYTSARMFSTTTKQSFERMSSNLKNKPFSQTISGMSFQSLEKKAMSTSSKGRFCSKLNMPTSFSLKEDKKLARELFPSVPRK